MKGSDLGFVAQDGVNVLERFLPHALVVHRRRHDDDDHSLLLLQQLCDLFDLELQIMGTDPRPRKVEVS